jgi:drug/metabolite transporter (DMT)-like permease
VSAADAAQTRTDTTTTLGLYALTVAIWGSTWLAITFQLGVVPATVSVVWRFALSALILFAFSAARRLPLTFDARDHLGIAGQGFFMFGANYVCVYLAEQHLASGLVAVVFSLYVFTNIFAMRLVFGAPIARTALLGAVLGVAGIVLIFWPQLRQVAFAAESALGAAYALAATLFATIGAVFAVANQRRRIPVVQLNAWGMLYGTGFIALYAMAAGEPFRFDTRAPYMASLLYLALFGSVIAFGAYLTLMRQIGADRAGYTAVAIPVVALLLSTLFEELEWQLPMLAGVALVLAGNVLMLRSKASHD